MWTDAQVFEELKRNADQAHPKEVLAKWREIDEYYQREAEIQLPEAASAEGDAKSLERLFVRTNFAKTIVNSTVTMVLASGIRVYDDEGALVAPEKHPILATDVRKLLRYASRYGAAWLQGDKALPGKPYRVYKPHVARRIMRTEDPEREQGVLVAQEFRHTDSEGMEKRYSVARWYEWDEADKRVLKREYVKQEGGDWQPRRGAKPTWFNHMPFIYVPNREEDSIPEQSDIIDGLPLFKQYDALRVKLLKALEDESFRLVFLSSVSDEVASKMKLAGGLSVWHAKNKMGEAPPELQSVAPADQRQFLDSLNDLVDDMATATRTSPLELNERPVQDIPAQTLRVLYGPQIERCQETVEHLNPALTQLLRIATGGEGKVVLKPHLPISEDKQHQNLKGLLDSKAYSAVELMVDTLGKTRTEAEAIFEAALNERRRVLELEAEIEAKRDIEVAKAQPRPTPPSA